MTDSIIELGKLVDGMLYMGVHHISKEPITTGRRLTFAEEDIERLHRYPMQTLVEDQLILDISEGNGLSKYLSRYINFIVNLRSKEERLGQSSDYEISMIVNESQKKFFERVGFESAGSLYNTHLYDSIEGVYGGIKSE